MKQLLVLSISCVIALGLMATSITDLAYAQHESQICITKPVCIAFSSVEAINSVATGRYTQKDLQERGDAYRVPKGTRVKVLGFESSLVWILDLKTSKKWVTSKVCLICDPADIKFWQEIYRREDSRE